MEVLLLGVSPHRYWVIWDMAETTLGKVHKQTTEAALGWFSMGWVTHYWGQKPGQWTSLVLSWFTHYIWLLLLHKHGSSFCTQRQIPNCLKRPWDLLSSVEKNLSTPTLINNHYRLLLSQFLDTMNVGPKGRSGDAQPHPRALCHTLGNPVPVPPKLGSPGQVWGGLLGELSDRGIRCQLREGMFRLSPTSYWRPWASWDHGQMGNRWSRNQNGSRAP